jgi:hypothetical protein
MKRRHLENDRDERCFWNTPVHLYCVLCGVGVAQRSRKSYRVSFRFVIRDAPRAAIPKICRRAAAATE